jgi:hypothetical protein
LEMTITVVGLLPVLRVVTAPAEIPAAIVMVTASAPRPVAIITKTEEAATGLPRVAARLRTILRRVVITIPTAAPLATTLLTRT